MKYLCHVYYEGGNGHSQHQVEAETPAQALERLLEVIKDDADPEEEAKPRMACEQVESILIEASKPLDPGQHPDTPPLWNVVGSWLPKRTIVTEWVSQPTDEDEAVAQATAAQAFAQALCPPGMEARVTSVTEFGTTGTIVPRLESL